MAGVSLSHWLVSHTSARSAVTSLPCAARKPGSDGEPHSSSPSISTEMRTGQAPAAFFQARAASKNVISWPLLSAAPRATITLPFELVARRCAARTAAISTARLDRAAGRRNDRRIARAGAADALLAWPTTIGCPDVGTTGVEADVREVARAPVRRRTAVLRTPGPSRRLGCAAAEQPLQRRILRGVEFLQNLRQLGAHEGTRSGCVFADVIKEAAMNASEAAPLSTAARRAGRRRKKAPIRFDDQGSRRNLSNSRVKLTRSGFSGAARTDMGRRRYSELSCPIRRQRVECTA